MCTQSREHLHSKTQSVYHRGEAPMAYSCGKSKETDYFTLHYDMFPYLRNKNYLSYLGIVVETSFLAPLLPLFFYKKGFFVVRAPFLLDSRCVAIQTE